MMDVIKITDNDTIENSNKKSIGDDDANNTTNHPVLQSKRTLYVGGLADGISDTMLRAAFVPFGPLKNVDIPMDYAKGTHRGFAFVEFIDPDDASEAVYNMDGAELNGKAIGINLARDENNSIKIGSNRPVWSADEWFQEQAGGSSGGISGGNNGDSSGEGASTTILTDTSGSASSDGKVDDSMSLREGGNKPRQ